MDYDWNSREFTRVFTDYIPSAKIIDEIDKCIYNIPIQSSRDYISVYKLGLEDKDIKTWLVDNIFYQYVYKDSKEGGRAVTYMPEPPKTGSLKNYEKELKEWKKQTIVEYFYGLISAPYTYVICIHKDTYYDDQPKLTERMINTGYHAGVISARAYDLGLDFGVYNCTKGFTEDQKRKVIEWNEIVSKRFNKNLNLNVQLAVAIGKKKELDMTKKFMFTDGYMHATRKKSRDKDKVLYR
jgi:hypothetical protein